MKNTLLAFALAIAALGQAQAQSPSEASSQTRFFVGTGLSFGGDRVDTYYRSSNSIRAGAGVAFTAGVDFPLNEAFSLQASVGYHVATEFRDGGHKRFQRVPVELVGYYHLSPQWRIGAGARSATNAGVRGGGDLVISKVDYDNSTGGIVEVEHRAHPSFGLKLRYVSENFTRNGRYKVDADHVGFSANYYF